MAERTYRIRLNAPDIATKIRPGQFVMLRLPRRTDPLLGRPFALYDVTPDGTAIDIVYLVLGKMTSLLAEVRVEDHLDIWGPLGKPFLDVGNAKNVTFVAGGIGQTPFLAFAKELLGIQGYGGETTRRRVDAVTLYYGVRTATLAAGVNDFRNAGVDVHMASDDGSLGYHGYVTPLLKSEGRTDSPLVGCGPEPMLRSLIQLAKEWQVPCQVSLETPMACGAGICYSCVTKVRTDSGDWDYKRVCIDGPAFDAHGLAWDGV